MLPRRHRHHHEEMPEHIHWEGPSPWVVLAAFGGVLVVIVALTAFVQHNCTMFHVCSDMVPPRTFEP